MLDTLGFQRAPENAGALPSDTEFLCQFCFTKLGSDLNGKGVGEKEVFPWWKY